MSIDPEDELEEALRGDLPTPAHEARLRRRLLAAGVAIGQGVATSTAAAAGAGGVAAKMAGLSWGLTLGFAAVVAIPTAGLLLDGLAEPAPRAAARARPAGVQARPQGASREPTTSAGLAESQAEPPAVRPEPTSTRTTPRAPAKATSLSEHASALARPSQADFAPTAAPTETPPTGSSLAEETRLLDSAFAQLSAGNLGRATALLQEHEARFPRGLLQKERERAKARVSALTRGE